MNTSKKYSSNPAYMHASSNCKSILINEREVEQTKWQQQTVGTFLSPRDNTTGRLPNQGAHVSRQLLV